MTEIFVPPIPVFGAILFINYSDAVCLLTGHDTPRINPLANNSFCPAAWNSVYLEPSGKIDSCCVGRNNLGNINNDTVENILVGPVNTKIQQDMLDDNVVNGCLWCHNKPDSLQSLLLERFPRQREDQLFDQPGQFKLEYLDARWSNTCNLACVYCGPQLSSLWAKELGQEHRIDRAEKNQMLEYVINNVESLNHAYFAGGEPLLMKENEAVVQAIKEKNPDCSILVNTNLLNIKNNQIFNDLTAIKHCEWLVSVDAMNQQYEYIRWPGQWSEFAQNLLTLKETVGVERIKFNMVLMSINALSFWDTVDWLEQNGFLVHKMSAALYNNGVYEGPFDIRYAPVEYQQQILDRMNQPRYQSMTGWQNCFDYVKELVYNKSDRPWKRLQELDHQRGLNSQAVFTDFYRYQQ